VVFPEQSCRLTEKIDFFSELKYRKVETKVLILMVGEASLVRRIGLGEASLVYRIGLWFNKGVLHECVVGF
jgi:hypothetical protein